MYYKSAQSRVEEKITKGRTTQTDQEQSLVSCGKFLQNSSATDVVKNHRKMLKELKKNILTYSPAAPPFSDIQVLQGKKYKQDLFLDAWGTLRLCVKMMLLYCLWLVPNRGGCNRETIIYRRKKNLGYDIYFPTKSLIMVWMKCSVGLALIWRSVFVILTKTCVANLQNSRIQLTLKFRSI